MIAFCPFSVFDRTYLVPETHSVFAARTLGRGELLYNFRTLHVRIRLEGGRFVRVFGTRRASRLLAVARSLEEKKGGALVFKDEGPS